jgi:hypothetical protein
MADVRPPAFQSTIKKVEEPSLSILDRIAEYLGYEKKSMFPDDAKLMPDDLKPRPNVKTPISQPYKDMKKNDGNAGRDSLSTSVSVKTRKALPSKNVPLATLPKTREVDAKDPRNTQFLPPVQATPEEGVLDFLSIPAIDNLVKAVQKGGPSPLANISDKLPERENIAIADEFTNKIKDKALDLNRIDLGPAMALADFWTGGKSKLAASYKAPKSNDEILQDMMALRQAAIKERDDAELKQKDQQLDAYNKLFILPRQNMFDSISRIFQGAGKDINGLSRVINTAMQSGENTLSNNTTDLQLGLLRTRTQREQQIRDNQQRSDELAARINSHLGRQGGKAKRDYYEELDQTLAGVVAPKFTPKGQPLPSDRKEWSSKNSKALGAVQRFADFIISSRGYDVKKADIDELMQLRLKVLNEISMGYHNGEWVDQELNQLHKDFTGNKGD